MRVTNNMILRNSSYNINGTKGIVNNTMNQMTTQKKINKPSDDPVVAIRSLRLSTSLSRVNQYYEKNIPDAKSWLDVTETALSNIKTIMGDIRTQCVNGATDTLTQDDRNTILSQIKAMQEQVFAEGNADYAGRTVFTGFRTDKNLVFTENEKETSYEISQELTWDKMESYRYFSGQIELPTTTTDVMGNAIGDTEQTEYYRMRLAYNGITELTGVSYAYGNTKVTLENGTNLTVYDSEKDWLANKGSKSVENDQAVFIKGTGELILGNDLAKDIRSNKANVSFTYDKTGFKKGELKPEYYFNCTDKSSPNQANHVTYSKYDANGKEIGYDINYTVSANQEITVNMEASTVFNSDIQRDVDDLMSAVSWAIEAHNKVDELKRMKNDRQYAEKDYQDKLEEWITAAQKEADYADDHMQKIYSREIGKVDGYLENINLSITRVGCTVDQIELTETRMNNQQETIQSLQSENDDLELSEIIIRYTASYNAYQSSLTAAGKLSGMTLLNYI